MTTPVKQDLRRLHAQQTRDVILTAFAACLEEDSGPETPFSEIARRAGVSEKTVYRHFPNRSDLIAGMGSWIRERAIPMVPMETLDNLPDAFRTALRSLDSRPALARVLALSDMGKEIFSPFESELADQLSTLITEANPDIEPVEHRRALAALRYLDSIYAWIRLKDEFSMDAEEIADIIGWLMRMVIANVRDANVAT